MKKEINIKTEKGLVELFKSVHPDKRLSKEVKTLLISKLKKYNTISQKQFDKMTDLLIKAGKIAYSNKRMTVKLDDIKQFAKQTQRSNKKKSTSKKYKKSTSKKYKKSTSKKDDKTKKYNECKKNKIATVMREFKNKTLKAKPGYTVTNPKQAIAIALSEAKRFC